MASSTTPRNTRPGEQPDADDQARPNGQRADQTTSRAGAPVDEVTRDATAAPIAAVGQILRQSQDGALRTARMWKQLFALLNPAALLAAPDERGERDDRLGEGAVFPARAFADGAFEMVATVLATQRRYVDQVIATQRRYVDQVLGTQRQLVGQLLDAGEGVAATTRAQVARVQGSDRAGTGSA